MTDERDPDVPWYSILRGKLPLETETAWYVLVSVLDVVLTYLLLRQSVGEGARVTFYESNPFARWILHHYGIKGMIFFKFGLVSLVAVLAQVIATRRPVVARWVLLFGTAVVGGVVVYSGYLLALAVG
jgi:hypothetical protein